MLLAFCVEDYTPCISNWWIHPFRQRYAVSFDRVSMVFERKRVLGHSRKLVYGYLIFLLPPGSLFASSGYARFASNPTVFHGPYRTPPLTTITTFSVLPVAVLPPVYPVGR